MAKIDDTTGPWPPGPFWTVNKLSEWLGQPRTTIASVVTHLDPAPGYGRNAHYELRQVVRALYERRHRAVDPNKLSPAGRRMWYESEARRLEVEAAAAELISVEEMNRSMTTVLQKLVDWFDGLPRRMEAEGLPDHIVQLTRDDLVASATGLLRGQLARYR